MNSCQNPTCTKERATLNRRFCWRCYKRNQRAMRKPQIIGTQGTQKIINTRTYQRKTVANEEYEDMIRLLGYFLRKQSLNTKGFLDMYRESTARKGRSEVLLSEREFDKEISNIISRYRTTKQKKGTQPKQNSDKGSNSKMIVESDSDSDSDDESESDYEYVSCTNDSDNESKNYSDEESSDSSIESLSDSEEDCQKFTKLDDDSLVMSSGSSSDSDVSESSIEVDGFTPFKGALLSHNSDKENIGMVFDDDEDDDEDYNFDFFTKKVDQPVKNDLPKVPNSDDEILNNDELSDSDAESVISESKVPQTSRSFTFVQHRSPPLVSDSNNVEPKSPVEKMPTPTKEDMKGFTTSRDLDYQRQMFSTAFCPDFLTKSKSVTLPSTSKPEQQRIAYTKEQNSQEYPKVVKEAKELHKDRFKRVR